MVRNRFRRSSGGWSLARQLFALQVVIVVTVVVAGAGLAWYDAQRRNQQAARQEVIAVAETLAATPQLRRALRLSEPSTVLQPWSKEVQTDTGVDFITIMDPRGIRYTHPEPRRIGERFWGHIGPAVRGRTFTETYTGTLGPSVRAVAPVFGEEGEVRALVSVGIKVKVLTREFRDQLTVLIAVAGLALLLGGVGTYWVSNRLRRHTHGLRPAELSRMYEYHDAILHAVREGLLLVSPSEVLTLCNDGAAALLSVDSTEVEGTALAEAGLPESLVDTLRVGRDVRDEVHLTADRVVLVNVSTVRSGGRNLGSVVTLRDHTELQALTRELDSMRGFSESLRSQAHESAKRLHTVVSLIELGRTGEAVEFATAELALAQQLTDRVVGAVTEPVLAAVLLGKSAEAHERGIEVVLTEDTAVDEEAIEHIASRDLVTILGNLMDNAIEAVMEGTREQRPTITVTARTDPDTGELVLRVADNGPGLDPASTGQVFERGFSTRDDGRGLGLALVGQSFRRYGGRAEVGEHGGAVFTVHLPQTAPRGSHLTGARA
ncbi:sensor histidine kinase regulating citrate/malate metabolism [Halopolyspora algeriensis]|uniref:histidine kinase n=1 Tax=Halopolyspora algeriensis TaxID=1500506 RepID=A0A368VNC8_9ACTN|nr:sensor histidine kinase [Halopolyspora algeriensis]RCW43229.1 sensor histidine kinase regulating citrate/malate metabolism [Halopolyspora algeriensis]TQM56288.1 sensor histidine kinase regulating citrate/malate metabolism [Halopolyspora algeriensis]